MKRLTTTKLNELIIIDDSGEKEERIKIYYRNPTYTEIIKYSNSLYSQKKGKIIITPEIRVDYGAMLITGFEDGAYGDEDGNPITAVESNNGKEITIDGEKLKLVYYEDWKDILKIAAPTHLAHLALKVFESTKIADQKNLEQVEIEITEIDKNGDEPNFSGTKLQDTSTN